jgi:glycine hydroxymethyltransferase
MITSGLRIGTPALATRGFDDEDFTEVADVIALALAPVIDEETKAGLRARVEALATKRPLYPNLSQESR